MSEAMLLERAKKLGLHGLCAHWEEADGKTWVDALLDWEEKERARRSLERRIPPRSHRHRRLSFCRMIFANSTEVTG